MAKVIELSLEGAEELNKALAAMTPKIAKGIVRRAMRPAMKPILQAVRAGAPVYWGYLRAGIKMRAVPSKRGVFGVQVQLPYREDLPIAPNDPTYYPASIEYGYTTKSGKHIAAKPFLRPAYDHNEANAERIFKAEVGKLIEEAWKKLVATIRTLNVSIKANTKKAEEGFKKLQKSNENLMASFATSAKVVAGFGVALGVAAAAGLTSFVKNSMESIDAQAKLADRLGGTIDGLRALQFIAGQSGSSSDALNNGLEKMVKNFGDAMRGTGEAKDALQGMGLSVQALAKMRPERAFMLIGDALKGMKSPAEQASAAQAIFGRGGQELLTTLLQGSEAIEEQSSAFIKLAGSISKVDASKVQAANDAIGEARKAVEGLGDRIAIAAAPAIKALADSFTKWAVEAKPSVDSVNTAISDTVRLISFAADGMRLLAAGWNLVRAAADKAAEVQAKTLGLFTEDSARGAGLRGMASSLAPQLSMAGHLGNLLELSQFFKQSGSLAASQAADNFERAAQHWSDLVNGKSSNALLESIAKINAESAKLSKSLQPKQTSRVQGGQSYAGIGNALPSMSAGRVLGDQLQAHLLRAVAKVQTPMFMLGKTLGQGIEASIALAKNHLQSMQDFADSVKESLKTPLDHFKDFGAQLAESVKLGLLSGTEAAQALGMEKERLLGDQSQSGPGFGALREIDLSRIDPGALSRQGKKTQEVRSKQLEEANKLHRAILEAIRKNSSMAVLG